MAGELSDSESAASLRKVLAIYLDRTYSAVIHFQKRIKNALLIKIFGERRAVVKQQVDIAQSHGTVCASQQAPF